MRASAPITGQHTGRTRNQKLAQASSEERPVAKATRKPKLAKPKVQRSLHLVDIENLCGDGFPSIDRVHERLSAYAELAGLREGDFGFAAANRHLERRLCHELPSSLRWIPAGIGLDAADRALLSRIDVDFYARRYDRIVLGSGDGGFAEAVSSLVVAGLQVGVVACHGSLSNRLRSVASSVALIQAA